MFGWLGVALLIDGLDGPIARRLNVGEVLPNWSGDTLDLVVDFLTYVFVPAYAITASGLLIPLATYVLGAAIVISGALYFSDRRMKTDDNHFRGFPALWNGAAFYLFLLKPPPCGRQHRARRSGRADLRAVQRDASTAHRAIPQTEHRAAGDLGDIGNDRDCRQFRGIVVGHRRAVRHRRLHSSE